MKIIKAGRPPSEREYTTSCPSCGTRFSFLEKEGHKTYDQREGDFITVTCPLPGCSKRVTMNI